MNTNMKFTQDDANGSLRVSPTVLKIAGLHGDRALEYCALPGTVVAYKKQMTALELANTAHSLQTLADGFFNALYEICDKCEGCDRDCPYDAADFDMELELPEALLERAGIPKGQKLFVAAVDGGVLICSAEQMPSLQSVPGALMEALLACDACPGNLEKHIQKGDIVYGGR